MSLRVGVVGVGKLGFHHARILRDLEGVESGGVYDVSESRARAVADDLGVPFRESLGALLSACDAIVVAVPTVAHEAVAVAALGRGLHVLIEKPMAPDLAAADRILAVAGDRVVQIGHVERFNQAIRAAEPYLSGPVFIESHRIAPFTARSTDVAVVLDLMIHDVDLVGSLVGTQVEGIDAVGVPVLTPTVDIASARLRYEGGVVANLTASRISLESLRKLRIFQPSGYLSLDLAAGTGEFLRLKEKLPAFGGSGDATRGVRDLAEIVDRVPLTGDGVEPLVRELENFRDAAAGRARPAVSGVEGRDALALALAIEERIRAHVPDPNST